MSLGGETIMKSDNSALFRTFGNNLKALRESKGLSQAAMSRIMDTAPDAYGFYEKGKRMPTMSKIFKVADYFNISVDQLVLSDFNRFKIFWANIGYSVEVLEKAIALTLPSIGQLLNGGNIKGIERKILFPSKDSFIAFSSDIQRKFKTDFYANVNQALLDEYHKIQDGESDFTGLSVDEKPFEKSFVFTQ